MNCDAFCRCTRSRGDVVRNGSVGCDTETCGPVAARATMRARDRWYIASLTKAFTSTVVLQLEAEGKLDIDDPVERWLPGLVPDGDAITLRELMNHTGGLYNYTDDTSWFESVVADPARTWTPA